MRHSERLDQSVRVILGEVGRLRLGLEVARFLEALLSTSGRSEGTPQSFSKLKHVRHDYSARVEERGAHQSRVERLLDLQERKVDFVLSVENDLSIEVLLGFVGVNGRVLNVTVYGRKRFSDVGDCSDWF